MFSCANVLLNVESLPTFEPHILQCNICLSVENTEPLLRLNFTTRNVLKRKTNNCFYFAIICDKINTYIHILLVKVEKDETI